MDTLYKNIKRRRQELKMTQTDLAKAMGYSDKSMISRVESGKIDLPQSKIMEFARVLKIDAGDLMGWEDDDKSYYQDELAGELAQEMFDRPELRVLFDASRKATKEDIEQVADILKKLSGK